MVRCEEQLVWFHNKLTGLFDNSDVKDNLIEIHTALLSCNETNLQYFARNLNLANLFDALNSSNNEESELAINIIIILLHQADPIDVLLRYGRNIARALIHPSDHIKIQLTNYLTQRSTEDSLEHILLHEYVVYTTIVTNVSSPNTDIAIAAVKFLKKISDFNNGAKLLLSQDCVSLLQAELASEESRIRIYDLVIYIAAKSPNGIQFGQRTKILERMLEDLKSNDPLIQLNVLELLTKLVESPHGFKYLLEQNVVEYLYKRIINTSEDQLQFIVLPGLIHFFGNLIKVHPEFVQKNPNLLGILFSALEQSNTDLLPVLISVVSHIASTNDGKRLLSGYSQGMEVYMKIVRSLLERENPHRLVAIKALPPIFTIEYVNQDVLRCIEVWFHDLGHNIIDKLMEIVKLPFVDLRSSTFELLINIARLPPTCHKLLEYPGLVEYLLDRSTEFDNDCCHLKYDLVKSIANSVNASKQFDSTVLRKLEAFVQEGPYHTEIDPQVAFEGAT